jgi:hypothetical protein
METGQLLAVPRFLLYGTATIDLSPVDFAAGLRFTFLLE